MDAARKERVCEDSTCDGGNKSHRCKTRPEWTLRITEGDEHLSVMQLEEVVQFKKEGM